MDAPRTSAAVRAASLVRDAARSTGLLDAAASHHLASGGGGWRLGLALACCAALDVAPAEAACLAAGCELVHQASIVHDDMQDGALVRRGRPSVIARYGAPAAVCVGDHLLAASFAVLSREPGALGLIPLFASRVSDMAAGQAEEFAPGLWPDMTIERYRRLTGGKAGAAVALPIEGAAVLAGLPGQGIEDAGRAGRALGVAYQAGDDAADLAADLRHGALNGAIAQALHGAAPLERARLLALLDRARRDGLSQAEAAAEAARLAPHAADLVQWARGTLRARAPAWGAHRLGPVLLAAAASLAARLDGARPASHAA